MEQQGDVRPGVDVVVLVVASMATRRASLFVQLIIQGVWPPCNASLIYRLLSSPSTRMNGATLITSCDVTSLWFTTPGYCAGGFSGCVLPIL